MAGRSSFSSVAFSIQGDDIIEKKACGSTTSKSLFQDGVPVQNGLYDASYGTTEMTYNCHTCLHSKAKCPGHDGMMAINHALQQPTFRKEITKWLTVCCHQCGELVVKRTLTKSRKARLTEQLKIHKTAAGSYRECQNCHAHHPWVSADTGKPGILWVEYYSKNSKKKADRKEIMYSDKAGQILASIPDRVVLTLGKDPTRAHPKNLILRRCICIPGVSIRPEIRRIGGYKSSQSDATSNLKQLFEINAQMPKNMPPNPDSDTHNKIVLFNLTFQDMVQGSSPTSSAMKLMTTTGKTTNSYAARLSKKSGRFRGNLMGRRVMKMMRSVITGDKSLRENQLGIPRTIAQNMWVPVVCRPWNRNELQIYVANGPHKYPGCQKIKRIETGREHYMDQLPKPYMLQDGDVVYRNLIDGDLVCFLREPALTFTSITALFARIVNGLTLRMNPGICILFNADFDGDEMNGILIIAPESRAEVPITSSVNTWMMSYKNSEPNFGLFQDSVMGIFELTQSIVTGITKWHAMQMTARTSTQHRIVFDKPTYTGRELVSMFLPDINYTGKPSFYVPEFAPFFKYDERDTKIVIKNGQILSGVLDKASVGQGAEGGLFHIIYSEQGASVALQTMFNLQQLVNSFLGYYCGCTFGIKDIYLTKKTRQQIKLEIAKIIESSLEITRQFDEGKLVPPVGMTLTEYYEDLQMNALTPDDAVLQHVLREIDLKDNWALKFILSGAKGSKSNMLALFTAIGSIGIKGKRIRPIYDGRTSLYQQRYATHPRARGYNPNNFSEGIDPEIFPYSAAEGRHELIEVALSTAKAGTMSRNSIKNLEDMLASNILASVKANRTIQPLYGETGLDPRRVQKVKFPTVKISDADFRTYKTELTQIDEKWRNSYVQSKLDAEFKQLTTDRDEFRRMFLNIERAEPGNFLLKDMIRMPINPSRYLEQIVSKQEFKSKPLLDPVKCIDLVNEYCDSIGYLWMNEIQAHAKVPIPAHIEAATTLIKILIRSQLCTSQLIKAGADYECLKKVFDLITKSIVGALISAGTSVGIIAAQSVSEPMTQYLLDAKHRSGLRKVKMDTIMRFDELLGNRSTDKLHAPSMILYPREEWINDSHKVYEIANHIEMLSVDQFVSTWSVFVEQYGKPTYPGLEHEAAMIQKYAGAMGETPPNDLINWCIRMVFDEEELVLKSMKIKNIYLKLMEAFPESFIVFTPQTSNGELVMRIYLRNAAFKKGEITESRILAIMEKIKYTTVRGISGITNAVVKSIVKTTVASDGSLATNKINVIECDGENLSEVRENPYLDPYKCVTISVDSVRQLDGIEAARNRMASELMSTLKEGANYEHVTIYADEMSYAGVMTSIHRSGLGQREADNVLLRATFGAPNGVLSEAAINARTDMLNGMSARMVMGTTPRFGTSYNDIIIDEEEVALLAKSPDQILDDLD